MPATAQLPNYIQGRWCPSANSEYLAVTNPATHEVLTHVPMSGETDMATAVASGELFFPNGVVLHQ